MARKFLLYATAAGAVLALGILQADEKMSDPIHPKDPSVAGHSTVIWRNSENTTHNKKLSGETSKVDKSAAKKPDPSADCAGEWTRAVALITEPAYQNMMVIRNASNAQDAWRRANLCRSDVQSATFFDEGARLACAPYIACNAN
jgi:hypothetical protein